MCIFYESDFLMFIIMSNHIVGPKNSILFDLTRFLLKVFFIRN